MAANQADALSDISREAIMGEYQLQTPVAFLIFNRPDTTARVFAEIARARPARLFVIADGPRSDHPDDVRLCRATRAILDHVDWHCEVRRVYSEHNLGCGVRVSSGITEVFRHVEDAIILEDDCLPHPSFFRFCTELLDRYRCDEQVMHISGDNFQSGQLRGDASYYFSRYPHGWGWATWRRAWQHYDVGMQRWDARENRSSYLQQFTNSRERAFWNQVWTTVHEGRIDIWDYQWAFACVANEGVCIVPNVNLVSNIGFGSGATHCAIVDSYADMPIEEMHLPIRHPTSIALCREADGFTAQQFFVLPTLGQSAVRKGRTLTRAFLSAVTGLRRGQIT